MHTILCEHRTTILVSDLVYNSQRRPATPISIWSKEWFRVKTKVADTWVGMFAAAAAAAKSFQLCLTLCNPRDGSPPGSSVLGILQAKTLEWVAISFSNACEFIPNHSSVSPREETAPWQLQRSRFTFHSHGAKPAWVLARGPDCQRPSVTEFLGENWLNTQSLRLRCQSTETCPQNQFLSCLEQNRERYYTVDSRHPRYLQQNIKNTQIPMLSELQNWTPEFPKERLFLYPCGCQSTVQPWRGHTTAFTTTLPRKKLNTLF